jgi:hypothetical protein
MTELGHYERAEQLLLAAHGVLRSERGEQQTRTQRAVRRLTMLYEAWGKPEKAAEYRAMLNEK